jgi:hypothetical protein
MAADNGNGGNDDNNNGNDDDKYTGGTSAAVAADASTAERNSSVGSGAANGASGSADSGSADGNDSGANSGSDSGSDSAGVEYVTYRTASGELRQRRKRRDSRDNRSDSNARGSGATSGSADATETTGQTNETVSRVSPPPRRTRSTQSGAAPMAQNTRELVKDAYEFVFWSIGAATKVPDWELQPDEAKELAVRSQNFWNSLDKKKAQKFEAFANKWLPGITLAGAIVAVAAPRVKKTQQVIQERKLGHIQQERRQRAEAGEPVTEPARYPSAPSNESNTSASSPASTELNAAPLTDFSDITISE